mmetsp:Transcript_19417/g.49353  ORF Transcript_19417/g.49353 Transcript_19417/m.49353 type:complete len:262 (-) Transcript_19417:895-1680(-)
MISPECPPVTAIHSRYTRNVTLVTTLFTLFGMNMVVPIGPAPSAVSSTMFTSSSIRFRRSSTRCASSPRSQCPLLAHSRTAWWSRWIFCHSWCVRRPSLPIVRFAPPRTCTSHPTRCVRPRSRRSTLATRTTSSSKSLSASCFALSSRAPSLRPPPLHPTATRRETETHSSSSPLRPLHRPRSVLLRLTNLAPLRICPMLPLHLHNKPTEFLFPACLFCFASIRKTGVSCPIDRIEYEHERRFNTMTTKRKPHTKNKIKIK